MADVFRNLDLSGLIGTVLMRVIPALICITFHELSHGFVAYRLGDRTAKDMGRLTLNPIKHIDPFGLLMMLFAGFGWAKPVPVNMWNFKHPKRGMAVTALAGPVSNLVLASFFLAIGGVLYTVLQKSGIDNIILSMVIQTAYLNIAFAIFNIIPIPPLDGSKVLFSLLPNQAYYKLMRYERYGMGLLLIIVFAGRFGILNINITQPLVSVTQSVFNFFANNIFNPIYNLVN